MQMLKHNAITYSQLKPYIDSHCDCCIVNPCGSGKSSIIESVIEDYGSQKILLVTKQANAYSYYYNKSNVFEKAKVPIITYNALYNHLKADTLDMFKDIDICIFDEAHYMGASKWSMAVDKLREVSGCISIGVTATPQRFVDQGTNKSIVDKFGRNSVGNYTVKQLQKSGVFIEPEYIISLATIEDEISKRIDLLDEADMTDSQKEVCIRQLEMARKTWKDKSSPEVIMRDVLPNYLYRKSGNKILVFSKNVKSIKHDKAFIMGILKRQFPSKSIRAYEYSYQTSNNEFKNFLCDDTNYINVLFSVNKVCETIHISDLNILIFLRGSISNRIITQQIGRVNDINNKNKSLIIDMVDNLSKYGNANKVGLSNKEYDKQASIKPRISKPKVNCGYNYVHQVIHIFDKIDGILSDVKQYTYKGFRGSLKQICYVFRRNHESVSELIDMGYDIVDAMTAVSRNKAKQYSYQFEDFNFKLSKEEQDMVEKYTNVVYEIAKDKNCKDEDIIGDCQLYLCKVVHDYCKDSCNMYASAYIRTKILKFLLRHLQLKYDEMNLVEYLDEKYEYDVIDDVIKKADDERMIELLTELLEKRLNQKKGLVILLRYGLFQIANQTSYADKKSWIDFSEPKSLKETGEYFNLGAERIRQIESNALRKLRKPCKISRELSSYSDEYLTI